MPRPVYIICAESYSQDTANNLVSIFHVLEGFTLRFTAADEEGFENKSPIKPNFIGIAVWAREEEDNPDEDFEYENICKSPGKDEKLLKAGAFRFAKPHQRFITGFLIGEPWTESGEFVFTSRIRKAGESEWISQSYRVPITVEMSDRLKAATSSDDVQSEE